MQSGGKGCTNIHFQLAQELRHPRPGVMNSENQTLICQSQFTWIYIFIYAFFLILATWGQQNILLVKGKSCLSLACFVALDLHLERLSELEQYRPRGNMLTCSPSTRQKHAASGKQCYA